MAESLRWIRAFCNRCNQVGWFAIATGSLTKKEHAVCRECVLALRQEAA